MNDGYKNTDAENLQMEINNAEYALYYAVTKDIARKLESFISELMQKAREIGFEPSRGGQTFYA